MAAQHWTMHSDTLGEDRAISVHLPDGYDKGSDRYPTLYVLDGEQILYPIIGATEQLTWGFRGPGIIVVAIENTNRSRDFTVPWTSNQPPGSMYAQTAARGGGADHFLKFIQKELVPKVEGQYRTAKFRMIFGHSLGGLMAMHSFVAAPGFFNATIASSPTIDYNGDYVVDRAKTLFASSQGDEGFLFMSMAAREYDDSPRAFRKFQELLRMRAPNHLRWETRVFPDTDHGTVLLSAAQRGLEFVFPDWRLPTLVFEEGIDSIEKFYRSMSAQYGMALLPPERELDALARRLEGEHNGAATLHFFERYIVLYPESVDAHSGYSEALNANNKISAARDELSKAIQLAQKKSDPRVQELKRRLEKMGPS